MNHFLPLRLKKDTTFAKDSVRAILHKGMRTIYNTHMHKLAFDVEEMNEEQQKAEHTDGKAFSMIVHMKGTERSYQIGKRLPEEKILCKRDCAEVWGYL